MYYLSRRAFIMLTCSIVFITVVFFTAYGAYGAPSSAEDLSTEQESDFLIGDRQLQQVHAFFRHGQRTPADTYPNDPYLNYTFEPYDWGQLTNEGKFSLYSEIGQWLHDRYGSFVGPYRAKNVHVQTTGVSRTQMSMQIVLAGLFPPDDSALQWNRNLNWQPIPYFSEPLDKDTLLLVRVSCRRYAEAIQEVFKLPEVVKLMSDNQQLYQNLTELTGLQIATPDDVQSLFSTLKAESDFGLELPAWTKDYYPDKLLPLTKKSYSLNVYTDEMKRLKGGPFLRKTLDEWDTLIANPSGAHKKLLLYAGHDSTIVNLLSALQVWNGNVLPDYGIMGILELYRDVATGQYSVVVSRKQLGKRLKRLTIPGCTLFCPIAKLKTVLHATIPVDWTTECVAKDPDTVEPPPSGP
ncbi:venom acid phosphatase Acph-1-like [Anopheles cruzii]|uniref:venom acid phosphatase Acph-1-like n=1 Tax=Anopheles cruzii TaxID=68878 RepID=UPI0022EC77F7|nr:venom acid phosphatase Acph-1-like [Anopheles cruzii]